MRLYYIIIVERLLRPYQTTATIIIIKLQHNTQTTQKKGTFLEVIQVSFTLHKLERNVQHTQTKKNTQHSRRRNITTASKPKKVNYIFQYFTLMYTRTFYMDTLCILYCGTAIQQLRSRDMSKAARSAQHTRRKAKKKSVQTCTRQLHRTAHRF